VVLPDGTERTTNFNDRIDRSLGATVLRFRANDDLMSNPLWTYCTLKLIRIDDPLA